MLILYMGIIYTLHFFPIQGLKRKITFSKGSKNFCPRAIHGAFFWGTRGRTDSEKTKNIAVRTFVPQIFYYDQTILWTCRYVNINGTNPNRYTC